jgi:thiol-disulfide isomerase/thioredoxin
MPNKQQSAAQRREKQRQQRSQRLQGAQNRVQSTPVARRKKPTARKRGWNQSYMVGIVIALLAVIVLAFVIISHIQSTATPPAAASSQVFKDVTQVDPNILAVVGTGKLQNPLKAVQGTPPPAALVGPTGKPEFLYMGSEWCPYCAAQRWAMVVALSRFGTFSQLYQTTSSSDDVFPNTPTFSFYAKLYKAPLYTSQFIDFVPVEEQGNVKDNNGVYPTLQTPTAGQLKLFSTYDAPPYTDAASAGSIPFVDIANKFVAIGLAPGFSPQDLAGMQWSAIASSLADTSSTVSQHILGSANYLTAGICIATGQQPSSVCSTGVIQNIEKTMTKTAQSAHDTQIALNESLEADLRKSLW